MSDKKDDLVVVDDEILITEALTSQSVGKEAALTSQSVGTEALTSQSVGTALMSKPVGVNGLYTQVDMLDNRIVTRIEAIKETKTKIYTYCSVVTIIIVLLLWFKFTDIQNYFTFDSKLQLLGSGVNVLMNIDDSNTQKKEILNLIETAQEYRIFTCTHDEYKVIQNFTSFTLLPAAVNSTLSTSLSNLAITNSTTNDVTNLLKASRDLCSVVTRVDNNTTSTFGNITSLLSNFFVTKQADIIVAYSFNKKIPLNITSFPLVKDWNDAINLYTLMYTDSTTELTGDLEDMLNDHIIGEIQPSTKVTSNPLFKKLLSNSTLSAERFKILNNYIEELKLNTTNVLKEYPYQTLTDYTKKEFDDGAKEAKVPEITPEAAADAKAAERDSRVKIRGVNRELIFLKEGVKEMSDEIVGLQGRVNDDSDYIVYLQGIINRFPNKKKIALALSIVFILGGLSFALFSLFNGVSVQAITEELQNNTTEGQYCMPENQWNLLNDTIITCHNTMKESLETKESRNTIVNNRILLLNNSIKSLDPIIEVYGKYTLGNYNNNTTIENEGNNHNFKTAKQIFIEKGSLQNYRKEMVKSKDHFDTYIKENSDDINILQNTLKMFSNLNLSFLLNSKIISITGSETGSETGSDLVVEYLGDGRNRRMNLRKKSHKLEATKNIIMTNKRRSPLKRPITTRAKSPDGGGRKKAKSPKKNTTTTKKRSRKNLHKNNQMEQVI